MNLTAGSVKWLRPDVWRFTDRLTSFRTSFNDPFFNTSIEAIRSLSLHFHSSLWYGNFLNSSNHSKSHFQPFRPAEPSPTRHFGRSFTRLPVFSTANLSAPICSWIDSYRDIQMYWENASFAALTSCSRGSSRTGAFSKSSIYSFWLSRASKHLRMSDWLHLLIFSIGKRE